jgi:NADH-quinone oxidoreductase subunit I
MSAPILETPKQPTTDASPDRPSTEIRPGQGPEAFFGGVPAASAPPKGTATGRIPENLPAWERPSLIATLKGMLITGWNMVRHIVAGRRTRYQTISYPEQRRQYGNRFRGIHHLTKRPDGSLKCVACFMCATACPAECIVIEAGEFPDKRVEKYPVRFDIDMLRCVMCGLCVDACPEEAIVMTQDYEMAAFTRQETVYPISLLADRPQLGETPPGYRPRYKPGPDLVR